VSSEVAVAVAGGMEMGALRGGDADRGRCPCDDAVCGRRGECWVGGCDEVGEGGGEGVEGRG
jgi:hypothetical protein